MKTVSEHQNNRIVSDKMSNKKGPRKFLQTLQPSGDKENLVGAGRFPELNHDAKIVKPQPKTEVEVKSKDIKSTVAKVNPSLYKKLLIEDLTSSEGPSEKYWQVIAERRRKALEEVLDQNRKLHDVVIALEEENASCKKLLEKTTDLVNTLKEVLNEEYKSIEDDCEDDVDDEILSAKQELNRNNDSSGSDSD